MEYQGSGSSGAFLSLTIGNGALGHQGWMHIRGRLANASLRQGKTC